MLAEKAMQVLAENAAQFQKWLAADSIKQELLLTERRKHRANMRTRRLDRERALAVREFSTRAMPARPVRVSSWSRMDGIS